ncbi:efflux transporter outer membrane subunit [Parasphingorhabdus sp.]|uniref:efflux transporter outer membrane subunit n=1 Tax=Parasphingorhabdus sp. TaxID=2709688 RepID=UPI003A8E3547
MRKFAGIALAVMGLSACTVGPDYRPPSALPDGSLTLTETKDNSNIVLAELPEKWWQLFDDPVLDRLIDKALRNNNDLRISSANLQRSRALLVEAGAGRLPVTTASGSATRQRSSSATGATNSASGGLSPVTVDFFSVGFDASYEVDVFGGVSRSIESARADTQAIQAILDATRVSVVAETARTYALICSFAVQAVVARDTATLQERTLDLTQRLLLGGRANRRDVDRATLLLEQARAQVPQFESERRAALYALAVLTGDPPANADSEAAECAALPRIEAPLPVGNGRDLLARRPDVRQAERQLASDVAQIGVTTSQLYPSITLLGGLSLGSTDVGDLLKDDSFGYSIGPLISWNFPFNNAARARVKQSEAIADGSLAQFDKILLTALQETEQALARLTGAIERENALDKAVAASESAAKISRLRYDYGADSLFQLLDSESERAQARASAAAAGADRLAAQISLFKALGGGWQNPPEIINKKWDRE